jgi:peroxiredoxin
MLATFLAIPAVVAAVSPGQRAPGFSLPRLVGSGQVDLASQRGRVVVLDFWASWCRPCLEAMPELGALQRELGPRGVTVLAVSIDDEAAAALSALGSAEQPFVALHDAGGAVAETYGLAGRLPATVVIDREGVVRLATFGSAVPRATLRAALDPLL